MAEKMQTIPGCSPRLASAALTRSSFRKFRLRMNSISTPVSAASFGIIRHVALSTEDSELPDPGAWPFYLQEESARFAQRSRTRRTDVRSNAKLLSFGFG